MKAARIAISALSAALIVCCIATVSGCACSSDDPASSEDGLKASDIASSEGGIAAPENPKTVTSIEEEDKEDGSRAVTYLYEDGEAKTVIIEHVSEGGSGVVTEGDDEDPQGGSSGSGSGSSSASSSGSGSGSASELPAGTIVGGDTTEFQQFVHMTPEEQYDFFLKFESSQSFLDWYNAGLATYKEMHPSVEIKPGDVIKF